MQRRLELKGESPHSSCRWGFAGGRPRDSRRSLRCVDGWIDDGGRPGRFRWTVRDGWPSWRWIACEITPKVAEAVEIDRVAIRVQALDGLRITQPAIRRSARLVLALVPAIAAESGNALLRTIAPEHAEAAWTYPMTSVEDRPLDSAQLSFDPPRDEGSDARGRKAFRDPLESVAGLNEG